MLFGTKLNLCAIVFICFVCVASADLSVNSGRNHVFANTCSRSQVFFGVAPVTYYSFKDTSVDAVAADIKPKRKSIISVKKKVAIESPQLSENQVSSQAEEQRLFLEELNKELRKNERREKRRRRRNPKQADFLSKAEEFDATLDEFELLRKKDENEDDESEEIEEEGFEEVNKFEDDEDDLEKKYYARATETIIEDNDDDDEREYEEKPEVDPLSVETGDGEEEEDIAEEERNQKEVEEEIEKLGYEEDDESEDEVEIENISNNDIETIDDVEETYERSPELLQVDELIAEMQKPKEKKDIRKEILEELRSFNIKYKANKLRDEYEDSGVNEDEDLISSLAKKAGEFESTQPTDEVEELKAKRQEKALPVEEDEEDLMQDINEEDDDKWVEQGQDVNLVHDGFGNFDQQAEDNDTDEVMSA